MSVFLGPIIASISCPVSKEPLLTAQKVNCEHSHTISMAVAKKCFGEMNGDQCEKPGDCPISSCNGKVTKYESDLCTQEMVNGILTTYFTKQEDGRWKPKPGIW